MFCGWFYDECYLAKFYEIKKTYQNCAKTANKSSYKKYHKIPQNIKNSMILAKSEEKLKNAWKPLTEVNKAWNSLLHSFLLYFTR